MCRCCSSSIRGSIAWVVMSPPRSRARPRLDSREGAPAPSRSQGRPALFLARIVRGIDEGDVGGTVAVDLHDGLLPARPRIVRMTRRDGDESAHGELLCRSLIRLLAQPDEERAREHGDVLARLVEVGGNLEV